MRARISRTIECRGFSFLSCESRADCVDAPSISAPSTHTWNCVTCSYIPDLRYEHKELTHIRMCSTTRQQDDKASSSVGQGDSQFAGAQISLQARLLIIDLSVRVPTWWVGWNPTRGQNRVVVSSVHLLNNAFAFLCQGRP